MAEQNEREKVIYIDPDIASLIPEYLSLRRRSLDRIASLLKQGDFQTIQSLGHNMKGSGGSYGFQKISRLGALIESAAKASDAPLIARCLRDMEAYLDEVRWE